jgi:hypothetical protein
MAIPYLDRREGHFLQAEGQNFEVETKAYTKLRFISSIAFMKTCSFGTYLEPGIIFFRASVSASRRLVLSRRHLHSERRTYIEPESF